MSNNTAVTQTTNIVPVQGIFKPEPSFDLITFIGPAGTPFLPPTDPNIDGASITNSTINSTTIGATSPSTGNFTNIATVTGTISTTPSGNTDIANKGYVDSVAQGLDVKASCVYSTTADITLSGLATQAGGDWTSSLTAGDRILVKNQASSQFNGIYVASASTWARSSDMNVWAEVPSAFTFIESGTTLADTGWVCTSNQGGTIDVTPITWSQFSGAGSYLAGNGLDLIGNTFSVKANGTTLDVSSSGVKISDTYAGQTSITTVGTIGTGTWAGTAIAADHGGTGLTSYTIGDLIYASGTTTLSKLPDVATGNALISGGVGVAPSWGKIGLTTHVSGTLPIANGGTNATATPTSGAVAYGTGTAYAFSLAGTVGQVLISGGTGSPTWANYGGGDVTGPSSSTNHAIARFDGITGKIIQNSGVTIDDNANVAGARSLQFSGSVPATALNGMMWYDSSTNTLNIKQNQVTQQIGEEIYIYGRASENIVDGQVIYVSGSYGTTGVVTFEPAPIGLTDASKIIGIATETIAKNSFGRITAFGTIHDLSTSPGFADGDVLWYDPTVVGGYTKTEPSAPNIKCQVGIITKAAGGTNGSIAVKILPGSTLGGTDSNVQFGTLANNDLIQYSTSLGYWRNVATSTVSVGTATNLAGGAAASIPYQSASGTTAFLVSGAGDANKVLQSNGTSAPSWVTPVAYATVTDDTTTNAVRYPLFANQTTGSLTTTLVSSTKYNYNPSSGLLTATGFSGSGASLTSLPAGQLSGTIPSGVLGNSSLYIGTTSIALNRSSSAQSLTGVNIDGSAGSATTAGTATNANNVAITDDTTTAADMYLSWVTSTTGNLPIKVSSTKLKFNPSTGVLTATGGVLGGTF
jgi:hypothetical protein